MKVAGVVVTSAATLEVAKQAFVGIDEPWLTVIKVGALMLVEGAFIVSWLAIDTQHNAPMPMKIAWAVTLVVIYVALLVIALEHGEGAAGWAFRFVLAVMIGRSIYEAGMYELLKNHKKAERDIRSSFVVRRVGRQLAKKDAIKALNMESIQSNYARELGSEVARAKLEAEHEAALIDVKLMRERLLASVHAKDNLARKKFQAQLAAENRSAQYQLDSAKNGSLMPHAPASNGAASHTNGQASQEVNQEVAGDDSEDSNLANKKERLKDMLLWALMENPNHSKQALSAHVGASPGTIRKYLDELLDEGKLRTTNKTRSGFMVVQGDAMMN
ncbi:MAG: winged helix-turn-helix domain-containing protein [Rhodothermales bacterium]